MHLELWYFPSMKTFLITSIALLLVAAPEPAHAECAVPPATVEASVRQKANGAGHVIQAFAESENRNSTTGVQTVTWRVVKSWKGAFQPGTRFTTSNETGCCTCARTAQKGASYLLYLDKTNPYLLHGCGLFVSDEESKEETAVLDLMPATVIVSIK
jgi:hypothetical protein